MASSASFQFHPWLALFLSLFLISAKIPPSSCQPQNIQTFYPLPLPPPALPLPSQPPPLPLPRQPPGKSSSKEAVVKAIGATAATTLVLSGLVFFLFLKYSQNRRKRENNRPNPYAENYNEFTRFKGNLKGVIVDEDGLDVLYWKNLHEDSRADKFNKDISRNSAKEEEKRVTDTTQRSKKSNTPVQESPLLRGKSSTSHNPIWLQPEDKAEIALEPVEKENSSIQPTKQSPPPPQPPPPPPPTTPVLAVPKAPPPPPPPVPAKKGPAPPPTPPKPPGLASSSRPPPPPPKERQDQGEFSDRGGAVEEGNKKVKLKPLHWDKVNPNVEHSMVWHKIEGGSFRFDDDLMEALFGRVATNRKSPGNNDNPTIPKHDRSNQNSQVFILDARKSQNTAIVIRSLAISRREIIDALLEGEGLSTDALEKLTKIAPTKEEEREILSFQEDPTRLAYAESFLYHLLKAVPSAFSRFNAMLFRSTYDVEVFHHKETLQALELGCKELRTCRLFLKLLEAILKAGNRLNAGTSRGNAQAFNLTALLKLSDVKSTDGKTTLLNFVVEEVVRAEGKRLLNRNFSLNRTPSRNSNQNPDNSISTDGKERECIMFGLPIVGGLSAEFVNVKKAANIDYDAFAKTCSALTARIHEVRGILIECQNGEGGGFVREMKGFLDAAEGETEVVAEEEARVIELVKRTTEYYQSRPSKDKEKHPLQLFVIVKDFLDMVDKVCVEIARNLQKRKIRGANVGSSSPKSPAKRNQVRFPMLPENFMSDKSKGNSSELEEDF
ncbi:hypothetical protein NMG60_11030722 [Bertholletia excelsa]